MVTGFDGSNCNFTITEHIKGDPCLTQNKNTAQKRQVEYCNNINKTS